MDIEEIKIQLGNLDNHFRVNELKISEKEFCSMSELDFSNTAVPFVKKLNAKISLGNTIEYFAGLLHPQSLSSCIVPLALDVKENEIVADVAAAPGSKLTEISMLMKNKGAVVGNDQQERLVSLMHNISRLGVLNSLIMCEDAKKPLRKSYFDKVLVDAPCSALGSHLNAWNRFDERKISKITEVQKKMIIAGFDSLKQGGSLVYSTCTVTRQENEQVIFNLLQKRENATLENITIPYEISHDSGLNEFGNEFRKVWRIYPKHFNSEGFFLAKIKKN